MNSLPHQQQFNEPKMFTISKVKEEGKHMKSIFLKGKINALPGQFIMVWIPGIDEKPMAVSQQTSTEFAFAYHTIGPFTKAADKLKPGQKIGIRGPYGNNFSIKKDAVVVAGGIGMSSVATLIDALPNPTIIQGARSKDLVIYQTRFKKHKSIITTDDGTLGQKGFTTDALEHVLKTQSVSIVQTCGPEVMMKAVLDLCNKYKVPYEGSVERYMKCGFGICGNCLMDDKIVCIDGPIFTEKQLKSSKEFGVCARLKTGKKVSLKEYYAWRSNVAAH